MMHVGLGRGLRREMVGDEHAGLPQLALLALECAVVLRLRPRIPRVVPSELHPECCLERAIGYMHFLEDYAPDASAHT